MIFVFCFWGIVKDSGRGIDPQLVEIGVTLISLVDF